MTIAQKHHDVVQAVATMARDPEAKAFAKRADLDIVNVAWEDTGRYKGSSVGPNITDVTLQVQTKTDDARFHLTAMPVIRHPNFADVSGDIPIDKLHLLVGNEVGQPLRKVALKDYLSDISKYLSKPAKGGVKGGSLLKDRDTHVLASAQACFLPVVKKGEADFNVVAFNYQSSKGNPAVLTILATREGTSATIIDNARDPFEAGQTWGQRLFFNKNGERCSMKIERLSDFKEREEKTLGHAVTPEKGLDMVMLIQVPLVYRQARFGGSAQLMCASAGFGSSKGLARGVGARMDSMDLERSVDVEAGVMGHGEVEGPFTELDGQVIERDATMPIRLTVQFYRVTSNGAIDAGSVLDIRKSIDKVYADSDFVSSLVVEGETTRVTEHAGERKQPTDWWANFYAKLAQDNAGVSAESTERRLTELFGDKWKVWSPEEAERVRLSGRLNS